MKKRVKVSNLIREFIGNLSKEQQKLLYDFIKNEAFRYSDYYSHMFARGTEYDFETIADRTRRFVYDSIREHSQLRKLLPQITQEELQKIVEGFVKEYFKEKGVKHIPVPENKMEGKQMKIKVRDLKKFIRETTFTKKYDKHPSIKGKQDKLPDPVQKGIMAKNAGKQEKDDYENEKDFDGKLLKGSSIKESSMIAKLSDMSLDDQIDSLLIGFEKDATEEDDYRTKYNENFISRFMNSILVEQEKDEKKIDEPEGEEEEETKPEKKPEDKTIDNSKIDTEYPALPEKPKLDISAFSSEVARLISNHENLLDPRTVIFMRAANFLEKNYDKGTSIKFEDIMASEYGIELDQEFRKKNSAPYAVGAGPELGV